MNATYCLLLKRVRIMNSGFAKMSDIRGLCNTLCVKSWVKTVAAVEAHGNSLLMILGVVLLYSGTTELAHAGSGSMTLACNKVLLLIEGAFGALVAAVAGVAAIVAAAMGGFKMAWALVVVSVGAFILRAYITLFFAGC